MTKHSVTALTEQMSSLALTNEFTDVGILTQGFSSTKQIDLLPLLSEQFAMRHNRLSALLHLAERNRLQFNKMYGYTEKVNMNLKTFARVLEQVKECNNQFATLRTVIQPDPEEKINLFYFVMVPNDGALAHQPLIGRMVIPIGYPQDPPVLHLFTRTCRYNIDVYRGREGVTGSSMCFDILRRSVSDNDGGWKPNYSISCLFASLMVAVVSINVPQQYGGDKIEYVSMETLAQTKKEVKQCYDQYRHLIPQVPTIKPVYGRAVKAQDLEFGDLLVTKGEQIFSSSRWFSIQSDRNQENKVTACFDLSKLKSNIVFSVVLTSDPNDMVGKNRSTVLVRNGVTGTAAKKRAGGTTLWYYHGTPMNSGNTLLQITVAENQFAICLLDNSENVPVHKMKRILHGDAPVSFLTKHQMGDLSKTQFKLCIYIKVKGEKTPKYTIPCIPMDKGYVL
jgi:ubiquitin-protein ligase